MTEAPMPRIRSIKPEFFTDEEIAALPPLYRIAFAGLWCWADKKGRLEDKPGRLKHQILPYDDVDFADVIQSLHRYGFIQRYVGANKKRYIQVRTFEKHQRPRVDETPSQIPEPPEVTEADAEQSLHRDEPISTQSLGKEGSTYVLGNEYVLGNGNGRGVAEQVPPARYRAATLIQRRRKDAAWEGPRVYVPQRVHADFIGFRNHPAAERELLDWYEVVSLEWTTGRRKDDPAFTTDMVLFWKDRYAEQWPTLSYPTRDQKHLPEWYRRTLTAKTVES